MHLKRTIILQVGESQLWPVLLAYQISAYGKCLKTLYTKVSDQMANADGADPDQTASNRCIKSKILAETVWNKVCEILGHLWYLKSLFFLEYCWQKNIVNVFLQF